MIICTMALYEIITIEILKEYETVFTYNSAQYVLYLYIYIYIYLSIISVWGNYTVSVSQNKIIDMNVLIICHEVSQFYRF